MNYFNKVLVIAEVGVNHNGDINIAKTLCKAAKDTGADVVKFQTWITEKIITRNVEQAEYQRENTGRDESQFNMLKSLELSYDEFTEVKKYCDEIGITFASTADEEDSLDFLVELGIPFIKVGSGDVGNIPFLRYIGQKKLPVILSTGMSTLADVEMSLKALQDGGASEITLLHCTTNYPCPYAAVNLKAMDTLKNAFGLPVGYSDHTEGIEVAVAAVARGAGIIEKHFTLDKNMEGPDHKASTEPAEFKAMVESIRHIESALGSGVKQPTTAEQEISKVVLKRIVAKRGIKAGQVICEDDLCVKRNDVGVPANAWDIIVGSVARKDYIVDEGIEI
ncbi:N-acetylneuraminate synthase [Selenomonas sp. ND2010]|uniref:N-acetylneuraminate synthase n=1 Tax=Selenomonas sp. ND2010 TaxID=1410618 RepID=UPI00051BFEB1|nr:N-acetylneuraminate synthase [Selenomonas sp. ND2010]